MKKNAILKRVLSLLLVLVMVITAMLSTSCSILERYLNISFRPDDEGEMPAGTTKPIIEDEVPDPERDEFIDGLGGVSETFEGAVSAETFDTAEQAAEAFVAVEVVGKSEAVVVDTTSKGELSEEKIETLGIPAELQEGITAVEEFEISYTVEDEEGLAANGGMINLADKLNKTKKVTVYVIKYGTDWKYFTPAPITGDTITKSYYDSVFNTEKYKNCTLTTTMTILVDVKGSEAGQSVNMTTEIKTTQLIKHADNKVYLEQIVESNMYGTKSTEAIYAYLEEVDGQVVCYVKTDIDSDEWYETNLSTIGFETLEQLTPFYDQYLDYTYFTKTRYGFALEEENAKQYIRLALQELEDLIDSSGMEMDIFAEYYVSDGVLSGMRMDAEVSLDMSEMGTSASIKETITGTTTCTDYGTTVVEKPFEEN